VNTRLAQIIAASIGADGHPDPARIYEALRLIPDDPVAIIVEGVLTAQATSAAHEKLMAARLTQHEARTAEAAKTIADSVATLRTEREECLKVFAQSAAEVRAESTSLNHAALMLGTRALTAVFVFGLLLGALLCVAAMFHFRN